MILVTPMQSDSGFGLRQEKVSLLVIAACCEAQVLYRAKDSRGMTDNTQVQCKDCGRNYPNMAGDPKGTSRYLPTTGKEPRAEWVAHWMGWNSDEVEVKVVM